LTGLKKCLAALEQRGVLLLADAKLPSVVSVIKGKPIPGSWWQDAAGNLIYKTANELEVHRDVVVVKLLSGKLTFVHRRFWPALFAIGNAKESWQARELTGTSKMVLQKLEKDGELYTDALVAVGGYSYKGVSAAAKQLETSLLVLSQGFRVEGRHHRHLRSWKHWAKDVGLPSKRKNVNIAKLEFEQIVQGLYKEFGAKAALPWLKAGKPN
jgi:hypothetical protein